jgi:hypothetical protein
LSFSAKNSYQAHNLWLSQGTLRALGVNCHRATPRKLSRFSNNWGIFLFPVYKENKLNFLQKKINLQVRLRFLLPRAHLVAFFQSDLRSVFFLFFEGIFMISHKNQHFY